MTPEEIKALRKRRGLTQQQLAAELGVSLSSVTRWESERGNSPRGIALRALLRLILEEEEDASSNLSLGRGSEREERDYGVENGEANPLRKPVSGEEESDLEVVSQEEEGSRETEGFHSESHFLLFIVLAALLFSIFILFTFSSYLDF